MTRISLVAFSLLVCMSSFAQDSQATRRDKFANTCGVENLASLDPVVLERRAGMWSKGIGENSETEHVVKVWHRGPWVLEWKTKDQSDTALLCFSQRGKLKFRQDPAGTDIYFIPQRYSKLEQLPFWGFLRD